MANPEFAGLLYLAGFTLVLVGIIVLAMSIIFRRKETGKGEIGGVILIGPFPIVFGTSSRMKKLMLIIAFVFIAIVLLMASIPHLIQGI